MLCCNPEYKRTKANSLNKACYCYLKSYSAQRAIQIKLCRNIHIIQVLFCVDDIYSDAQ
jgi:hypothetical protein